MMIKKIIFNLLILFFCMPLFSADETRSSLYYVKLGAVHPPGEFSGVLPTLGIGARFQKDCNGYDLSANLGTIVFINYASLKGLFLYYPYPEKSNQLYYGVGPGVGYHISSIPMGGPYGSADHAGGSINLEGVLGYEFRHSENFKTFVQIELTQPMMSIGHGRSYNYKPGIALTGGFGF